MTWTKEKIFHHHTPFFLVLLQLVISYEKKAKGKHTKHTSTKSPGYNYENCSNKKIKK